MERDNNIVLKWGNIRTYCLPVDCESYKLINQLEEREEKLREGKGGGRRDNRDPTCFQLCLRAIQKAPEDTKFWNDFTDTDYTKEQALDYIINYWIDY